MKPMNLLFSENPMIPNSVIAGTKNECIKAVATTKKKHADQITSMPVGWWCRCSSRNDAGGGGGPAMTGVVGSESPSSLAACSPATTGRSSSRSLSLPAILRSLIQASGRTACRDPGPTALFLRAKCPTEMLDRGPGEFAMGRQRSAGGSGKLA